MARKLKITIQKNKQTIKNKLIKTKMKKLGLTMLAIFIGMSAFAQKDELKAAEKALKGGDAAAAKTAVDQAEGKLEDKNKAKFYFLKAQTYYDLAKKNPSNASGSYNTAAKSFQDLMAYEKQTGKAKYTKEAEPMLSALINDVSSKSIKDYQAKDYASAKKGMLQTYMLSKKDTAFLEYAANSAYLDKDYETALKHFRKLKDIGYTGIATSYTATNVETGERENFGNKAQMDLMVKTKQYKDPSSSVSKSKRATVIKNIALILADTGNPEEALTAVEEARKENPKDLDMLMTQGNIYLKLDKKDKFTEVMKEAIEHDPNNAILHFNVGVMNQESGKIEEAKENYKKAISLDANYADAYLNMGAALLEKDKALVEEMNNNLSNFKKYDAIKAKQVVLYKEVLPYYEKAYELKTAKEKTPNIDLAQALMSLYENTGMDEKYKEMKAIWDASRE
jgi:tetratricopeptide (TPR) repeat protein